jgi:ubiquinone biosynthesis protein
MDRRELDLQREAASASELKDNGRRAYYVPEIDWDRTRRVMTLEWVDGIKLNDRDALIAAGHDPKGAGGDLVRAFLTPGDQSTASSTPTCTRAICSR